MKKILILTLLMCAHASHAEWMEIYEDDDIVYFLDAETKNNAQKPRIAVVRNFKTATASGDQSARLMYEADCDKKALRLLSGVYLKKSMGSGEVSGMINSNGWLNPETRPVHRKIYASLCPAMSD
jgi:hypothetical protein